MHTHSRNPSIVVSVFLAVACAASVAAQSPTSGDGVVPGDYIRVSGGITTPLAAKGSLRDWRSGPGASVVWENWQPGSSGGAGNISFGFVADYSRLPFDQERFVKEFQPLAGGTTMTATASDASVFELDINTRFRLPNPVIVPSFILGFGFLHYSPSTIKYIASTGGGETKQKNRTGGSFSVGGALDRLIYGRTAIFGEAVYTYALTSIGGYATPGGVCVSSCDVNQNSAFGEVRGGLRVRLGRQ